MTTTTIPEDVRLLAERVGIDPERVRHNCHGISLAIVRSGIYPGARVARGWCKGVSSQHSWVVVGDPYDQDARIIDASLWSYDPSVTGVWQGSRRDGRHTPHGAGSIWEAGQPIHQGGPTIWLTPSQHLSASAEEFVALLGPLDRTAWAVLANGPMEDWPSNEIVAAMLDTPELTTLVPIDIEGMVTDRNPSGLYLRTDEGAPWMTPKEGEK